MGVCRPAVFSSSVDDPVSIHPGRNTVDGDAVAGHLHGQAAAHADHGCLGRTVGRLSRIAHKRTGDRCNVDDAAVPVFQHVGQHRMGDVETGGQVAVDGFVPLPGRQLRQVDHGLGIAHLGHAGVVDQDVDAAELADHIFHQGTGLIHAGQVGRLGHNPAA